MQSSVKRRGRLKNEIQTASPFYRFTEALHFFKDMGKHQPDSAV